MPLTCGYGFKVWPRGESFQLDSSKLIILIHSPYRATVSDVFHGGSPSAIVNIGLDAFVKSASAELPNLRLNTVSATVLEESADAYASVFPGFPPVPGAVAAAAFVRSVYGAETGQTIRAWT